MLTRRLTAQDICAMKLIKDDKRCSIGWIMESVDDPRLAKYPRTPEVKSDLLAKCYPKHDDPNDAAAALVARFHKFAGCPSRCETHEHISSTAIWSDAEFYAGHAGLLADKLNAFFEAEGLLPTPQAEIDTVLEHDAVPSVTQEELVCT